MSRTSGSNSVVFITDVDYRIDELGEEFMEKYIETRRAILERLGIRLIEALYRPSPSGRGLHFWWHCEVDGELSDEDVNNIQLLLGDDVTRWWINRLRIMFGMSGMWNKCFSLAERRRSERCDRCRIVKYLREIKGSK